MIVFSLAFICVILDDARFVLFLLTLILLVSFTETFWLKNMVRVFSL